MDKRNSSKKSFSNSSINTKKSKKVKYLGKYTVLSVLGKGAFGSVYKCMSPSQEIVAIKKLTQYNQEMAYALEQEGLLEKDLKHRNIVQCYEIFKDNKDVPHLVLEYCNQGTLTQYLANQPNNVLQEKEALNVFCQVLQGLTYLHKKGVVHRDIKSSNIVIHNGVFKIADFGIAKQVNEKSKLNQMWGTIPYMAPEILEDWRRYNVKVDIWALMVMLYEMMYAEYPFGNCQNMEQQAKNIREKCINGFSVPYQVYRHNNTSEELKQLFQDNFQYVEVLRMPVEKMLKCKFIQDHIQEHNQMQDSQEFQLNFDKEANFYSSEDYQKLFEIIQQKEDKPELKLKRQQSQLHLENSEEHNMMISKQIYEIEIDKQIEVLDNSILNYKATKMKDDIYKNNCKPYNLCIQYSLFLKNVYEELANENITDEAYPIQLQLTKFFIVKTQFFYVESFLMMVKEKYNIFSVDKWIQFANSRVYTQLVSQIKDYRNEIYSKLLENYKLVKNITIQNEDIQKSIKIDDIIPEETFYCKLPDYIKYPLRALLLITYKQLQTAANAQLDPQMYNDQKEQYLKDLFKKHFEEKHLIIKKCALKVLICSVFLKVFRMQPPYINLSQFDVDKKKITTLLPWLDEMDKKMVDLQSHEIIEKYFPKFEKISIQL